MGQRLNMKRRDTGILGEKLAQNFLKKRGYRVLATNYRTPEGEVDIIGRNKDTLVFIEVRTRKSLDFGIPEESITPTKMERLKAVAEHYRQTHENLPSSWRIDVVAIEMDKKGKVQRINLIENAIGEE